MAVEKSARREHRRLRKLKSAARRSKRARRAVEDATAEMEKVRQMAKDTVVGLRMSRKMLQGDLPFEEFKKANRDMLHWKKFFGMVARQHEECEENLAKAIAKGEAVRRRGRKLLGDAFMEDARSLGETVGKGCCDGASSASTRSEPA